MAYVEAEGSSKTCTIGARWYANEINLRETDERVVSTTTYWVFQRPSFHFYTSIINYCSFIALFWTGQCVYLYPIMNANFQISPVRRLDSFKHPVHVYHKSIYDLTYQVPLLHSSRPPFVSGCRTSWERKKKPSGGCDLIS